MEIDALVRLLIRERVSHNSKLWIGLERNVMMDYVLH